jgi:ribosomal protein L11 methyltransferase
VQGENCGDNVTGRNDGRAAASIAAQLVTDAATARRIARRLGESLDPDESAVSVFAQSDGRCSVALHFRHPPDRAAVRALVAEAAGAKIARALVFAGVPARDWIRAGLDALPPVEAGRFVLHGSHDRGRAAVNRIAIEIDAGLAFGTGHHGTTRGCLLALDRLARRRKRTSTVLDLGTGSGVLAIAAAKALRGPIAASDIDARALRTARDNARRNAVAARIAFVHATDVPARLRHGGPFDIVLANILLGPLQRLAVPLTGVLAPCGRLILSGLLAKQGRAALAVYRTQGLALERRVELEGWVTLVLRRPA